MKTNPAARRIIKVRFAMFCLAIASLVTIEVAFAGPLVNRIGQTAAVSADVPAVPNAGVGDFIAALR